MATVDEMPVGDGARAWLYATARRVLANQARGNARRRRLSERLSAQPVAVEADESPLAGRVHDALAALGQRDREVLLLSEWEGLTTVEIATVLGCLPVTVRGRLHRARRRFRAAFEAQTVEVSASPRIAGSPILGRCEL